MVSNFKKILAILCIAALPLIALLWRGIGWGADSFAFYAVSCGQQNYAADLSSNLFASFLPIIGCNFILISTLMLLFYFAALLSLWQIAKKVLREHAWLLPIYAGTLTPLFFIEGMRFENDLFGWSLTLVGIAVLSIGLSSKKLPQKLLLIVFSIAILVISTKIWLGGVILWGICLCFLDISPKLKKIGVIGFFLAFIYFQWPYLLGSFNFNSTIWVAEEIPLIGIVFILHLIHFWKKVPQPFTLYSIGLLALGLLKSKYMFLYTPFLLMAVIQKEKATGLFLGKAKFKIHPILFCAIFGIGLIIAAQTFYPTQTDVKEIQNIIQISKDTNIPLINDWGSGWLFIYLGKDTPYKSNPSNRPDWNNLQKPYYAYSTTDLNCTKLTKNTYLC